MLRVVEWECILIVCITIPVRIGTTNKCATEGSTVFVWTLICSGSRVFIAETIHVLIVPLCIIVRPNVVQVRITVTIGVDASKDIIG